MSIVRPGTGTRPIAALAGRWRRPSLRGALLQVHRTMLLGLALLLCGPGAANDRAVVEALTAQGQKAFIAGRWHEALTLWTRAIDQAKAAEDAEVDLASLRARRAEVYTVLGHFPRAAEEIGLALAAHRVGRAPVPSEANPASPIEARLYGILGRIRLLQGDPEAAELALRQALALGRGQSPRLEALSRNHLGAALLARDDPRALDEFRSSLTIASRLGDARLAAAARTNMADYHLARGRTREARDLLDHAGAGWLAETDSAAKGRGIVAIAERQLRAGGNARSMEDWLHQAVRLALALNDAGLEAYARGYLGAALEAQDQLDGALEQTRLAAELANRVQSWASLYLWQAQLARLHQRQGEVTKALAAYRETAATLISLRGDLVARHGGDAPAFERAVAPALEDYIGLLIDEARRAQAAGSDAKASELLGEARAITERLRTAELENYFRDDCVATLQSAVKPVDRLDTGTAVLYTLLLPSRTELLLSLPPHRLLSVPAGASTRVIEEQVLDLLDSVQNLDWDYPALAKRLYASLIAPVEPWLREAGIHTLVVVPDGALRTLPFGVLRDQQGYLIEKRAFAVTPGLTLLDPRVLPRNRARALLGGISRMGDGARGSEFVDLPQVADELKAIGALFPSTTLLNEQFTGARFSQALAADSFQIVHVASHARIASDARQSFVLTADAGRVLDMNALEALIKPSTHRQQPVELLTLSACATAVGSTRAALGLAGVAVKSGARSALASLWQVDDRASSKLIGRFYRELSKPGTSKAEALRSAQHWMAGGGAGEAFRHPYFWGAFLLIGNWL